MIPNLLTNFGAGGFQDYGPREFPYFLQQRSTTVSFFPFPGAREEWEGDSGKQPGGKRTKNTSAREISSREGEREAGGGGGGGQVEGE